MGTAQRSVRRPTPFSSRTKWNKHRKTKSSSARKHSSENTSNRLSSDEAATGRRKHQVDMQTVTVKEPSETLRVKNGVSSLSVATTGNVTATQASLITSNEASEKEAASEKNVDPNGQILAVRTEPIPGYNETFLLCTVNNNEYKPIANLPVYLDPDSNQLMVVPAGAYEGIIQLQDKKLTAPEESTIDQKNTSKPELPTCSKVSPDTQSQITMQSDPIQDTTNDSETNSKYDLSNSAVLVGPDESVSLDALSVDVHEITINPIVLTIEEQTFVLNPDTLALLLCDPDACAQLTLKDGHEIVLTHKDAWNIFQVTLPPNVAEIPDNPNVYNIEEQQSMLDPDALALFPSNSDSNARLILQDGTEIVLTDEEP